MKTININLIGNLGRTPVKAVKPVQTKQESTDPKIKVLSVTLVVTACFIFAISFLMWLILSYSIQKTNNTLAELKSSHERYKEQLAQSTLIHKTILKDKKILEIKLIADNIMNDKSLPWFSILKNIGDMVPKDIKVTKISRLSASKSSKSNPIIEIEGQLIPDNTTAKPIQLISYLIMNINENSSDNLYLTDATVKEIDYNETKNLYDFKIQARIKTEKDMPELVKAN